MSINYFASGDHRNEQGVYQNNYVNRDNARLNLHANLSPKVEMSSSIGFLQSGLGLPQNDNASYGVLSGGLLGSAFNDPVTHGYLAGLTPDSLAHVLSTQSNNRLTGSATITWRPLDWLSVVGVTGLDYEQLTERQLMPSAVIPIFPSGFVQTDPITNEQYTTNVTATAHYNSSAAFAWTTSAGTQYSDQRHSQLLATGQGLLPGVGTLGGATNSFTVTEDNPEEVLFGGLIQQQLAWRDKVFLTAAVRTDKNSALDNGSWTTYPDASLSWVIGEEPFFPKSSILSSLRLRTAYGESGERPSFRQPNTFFSPAPAKKDGVELVGAIDTATGNPNLTAEISREFEGGFDAGFLSERIQVQATVYSKTTDGTLVQATLPPGTGGDVQFLNLGQVTNRGFEIGATGTIYQSRNFAAEMTVNGSVNHNKLIKLGPGISPITFDAGDAGDTQAFTPGYSLGGYWSFPYTFKDLNHDGIIEPNEITVGSTPAFFGNSQPTDEFSFTPALTFFKSLRVQALFDRRAGNLQYNGTEEFRCGFSNTICKEAYDPHSSLAQQAAAITETLSLSDAGAYEDASFWKFRELTVRYSAPESWAHRMNARSLAISVSGRNLATWTKYTGFDPEINFAPNVNNGYNPFTAFGFPHAAPSSVLDGAGGHHMVTRQLTTTSHDRSAADVAHSRRAPHRMRLLLAVLLMASMAACDVNRLLDAKDKDTSPVGSINSATGLPNAYAGAISQFQVGWAGSAADLGDGNEGQINMTALLTDEYIDLETFPTRIEVDQRITAPGNSTLRGNYLDLSQARVSAERAAGLYKQFDSTNVLRAEMLNLSGYSYLVYAEDYCSGIPFDSITPGGKIIYGQPLTTDSMYGRAMKDFQAALTIATADSIANGDAKGIEQINVARVAQARVLLDEGQFTQAANVAALVPLTFVYAMEGSSNSPREYNGVWYFTTQLAFSVADNEGSERAEFRVLR